MRSGQLKSLFIVAATAFSAAGCAHVSAPPLTLNTDPSAREQTLKNPVPPAPIPSQIFIDAGNFPVPVLASAVPFEMRPNKKNSGTLKAAARIPFSGAYSAGPRGFVDFCQRLPRECRQTLDNGPVTETPALLDMARKINIEANKEIEPISDLLQYKTEEFWTYPDSGKGDCEDYVLLKRRRLIAQGVPPEALLIAVVMTKDGEGHAVLVLHTDKNDYVLNNLTDALLPWTETDFQSWKKITSPGNLYVWRDLPQTFKRESPLSDDLSLHQQQDAPRQAVNANDGDNVARRPLKAVVVKPL